MSPREKALDYAMRLLLTDYRTEGCPQPDCLVCARSRAAKKAAKDALALPVKA